MAALAIRPGHLTRLPQRRSMFVFFLMIRRPPRSALFPSPTLFRSVQGLGGGTTGVLQAYVADSMVPAERAKALGWLSAATSAGVIVGPAIGSFMHRFGDAAPGVFAAALVLVNVRSEEHTSELQSQS